MMNVLAAFVKMLIAVVLLNPLGWIAAGLAVWMCDYTSYTLGSAVFFGLSMSAYVTWSLVGKQLATVALLVPVSLVFLNSAGISAAVLNGVFLSLGLSALVHLGRQEQWFARETSLPEPRW